MTTSLIVRCTKSGNPSVLKPSAVTRTSLPSAPAIWLANAAICVTSSLCCGTGAEAAGAKVLRPVEDQFYGDRGGGFEDPFGHRWFISTRKEDISPEEMKRRAAAKFGGG